ncbi:biotin--[acetyl-CoA-carboxylase] ligase [bacterium]|nr:biotin--[acetyl-CoA-carboxylase] ligase [candidate division CSSED10-310 bacterium]
MQYGRFVSTLFTPRTLFRCASTPSTNSLLRQKIEAGDGINWVVAAEQTAGRGRLGRKWFSPKGRGIYASFLFTSPSPAHLRMASILVGLALAEAVSRRTFQELSIKWPNDILLNGKKVAGALLERVGSSPEAPLLAGIGINCLPADGMPARQLFPASSLSAETHSRITPWSLLPCLARSMERFWLCDLDLESSQLMQKWRQMLAMAPVVVFQTPDGQIIRGEPHQIRDDGALVLITADGERHSLMAGDIINLKK